MLSQNSQMLERFISIAINTKFQAEPPTEEQFMDEAKALRANMPVSDKEFEKIIRNLKATLPITMDVGVYIAEQSGDHQSWLPARRADLDFFYWNRYRRYLEDNKGWNVRVTANLDIVSTEIVDLLGDPKSNTPWERRGLVLGDVQSGKTANYTAICNKAADTGYKVIIVLTGTLESLRKQTQERLDKEFAGRLSKDLLGIKKHAIKNVFDGVGKIDSSKRISAFTTVKYDFNSTILNSNDLTLKNISEPALFVVKKNKSVLKNLESWLTSNNADNNGKIDLPLLLIDDEADNASVNTKKDDEDPTAINAAIRSILKRFYKSSYLGITATPFANIFINPETNDEMVGDDLFPRDFIYVLSPPTNYIGADAIFGTSSNYDHCLIKIDSEEIDHFFPFSHKKDHPVDALPPSMLEAIGFFVLANAIRDLRGDTSEHRSMLVNVSRFTDVQVHTKDHINTWLNQMQSDLRNYASLNEDEALRIRSLYFLKKVWNKHGLKEKAGIDWIELQQNYLYKAAAPIEVRAVNQRTGAASLDYYNHKEHGFRVVAVGGNSLSRGLTLEGLCVSYFYRNSQMYDTLLQMGRWFGYRPGYDDVFKVWMADDAIDWYGFITEAANELKIEISRMNRMHQTPSEFGLKVRQDPNSLIVTARNKMRSGTPVSRPITVTGRLLETPRLKSNPEVLATNERVFRLFVANLDSLGYEVKDVARRGKMWSGISKDVVSDLLRSFDTHPWHLSFQGKALAEFIDNSPGLNDWDVFLPFGSVDDEFELDGANGVIKIKREERLIKEADGMIKISGTKVRVGSGGSTRAGLTEKEILDAQNAFRQGKNIDKKSIPDSAYLAIDRKPLLMLHVIKSKQKDDEKPNSKIPDTLFAIGIGLPGDGVLRTANYVVNMVELRNWVNFDDEEDDDDVV
ncbi:Z1 domain-containing protein [Cohnella sp. REN36]|uniref:Z1 domain-containing protein n=1 Tax=Cohnella sp. REN36 TaxID=2887347 RepID=UPI001D154E6E|nr:Z1 domain-containing protein [Cohnella sp. REN36]MCC3372295.1 Z1 domain-containing protein [Cohnella sp. REN36]